MRLTEPPRCQNEPCVVKVLHTKKLSQLSYRHRTKTASSRATVQVTSRTNLSIFRFESHRSGNPGTELFETKAVPGAIRSNYRMHSRSERFIN